MVEWILVNYFMFWFDVEIKSILSEMLILISFLHQIMTEEYLMVIFLVGKENYKIVSLMMFCVVFSD